MECIEGQIDIFDFLGCKEWMPIGNRRVKLIELFAGIGSQAMALKELGIEFDHHLVCEIDRFACESYSAIHGVEVMPTDITKLHGEDLNITDKMDNLYLLTYSFPCTDISIAGRMEGYAEGSGTRSSLLWEVKRLLLETKELPQILMMENVPMVHSKANMEHFKTWLKFLEQLGYANYWQDMDARDYGIAQSRNRTIVISLLGGYHYEFSRKTGLDTTMRDYLDQDVDEKYYILTEKAKNLIDKLIQEGKILRAEQSRAEQSRADWD